MILHTDTMFWSPDSMLKSHNGVHYIHQEECIYSLDWITDWNSGMDYGLEIIWTQLTVALVDQTAQKHFSLWSRYIQDYLTSHFNDGQTLGCRTM